MNRLKVNVQRMLYVLPVTMLYCMYVTWDAGELGVNTAWACGVALAIQVGTIIIIKFTNAEDFFGKNTRSSNVLAIGYLLRYPMSSVLDSKVGDADVNRITPAVRFESLLLQASETHVSPKNLTAVW